MSFKTLVPSNTLGNVVGNFVREVHTSGDIESEVDAEDDSTMQTSGYCTM